MKAARASTPLRDVLYQFSMAKAVPDPELLEEYVRQYPEHAAALTAFAVEAVVDDAHDDAEALSEISSAVVSPAVSRAMSRFQNKLFAVQQEQMPLETSTKPPSAVHNPFAQLDATTVRGLAKRLHANTSLVMKLRDRGIEPTTISDGFRRRLVDELEVPSELIAAHFAAPPSVPQQMYKAEGKPQLGRRQSFEEAVTSSGLSAEDQDYLLKL